jgi:hypothetical protein
MKKLIKKFLYEALILKVDKPNNKLIVQSNEPDAKKASQETFRNKEALKANGFKWVNNFWTTDINNFETAKETLSKINKSSEFVGKLEELQDFVENSEDFQGKSNLMDKINMYISDLANATDDRAVSAELKKYFDFFARFRGHSFYNTMLIWIQNPNATKVAGFRQWQDKFNRRVVKGAKSIMIFAPMFSKKDKTDDIEDDGSIDKSALSTIPVRFRPVNVFDIADTEPMNEKGEVPKTPEWFTESEPTERTKELFSYVKEAAEDIGIKITMGDAKGGEKGYSAGDHINMSSSVEGAGELSTLIHEFAHELMHWKKTSLFYQGDDVKFDSAIKELQAESVAYTVMKHYDLPVQHQPTYIALWKGNKEKILANIRVISEVAKFIIDAIDKVAERKQIDENLYL